MLFHGLARRVRAARVAAAGTDGQPFLDPDAPVADLEGPARCPSCGNQVLAGYGRCPGCGVLLMAGIRVRTAAGLLLVGIVSGMLGGAVVAGVAMAPRLAAGDAAIAASRAGGTGSSSGQSVVVWLPPGVAGGLRQMAAVNDRLAAASAELQAAIAAKAGAAKIAAVLRRVTTDARIGGDAARRLGSWESGADLATTASGMYATLMAAASDGLSAPLSKRAAYVAAGRNVRAALRALPGVATATLEAGMAAGIDLGAGTAP